MDTKVSHQIIPGLSTTVSRHVLEFNLKIIIILIIIIYYNYIEIWLNIWQYDLSLLLCFQQYCTTKSTILFHATRALHLPRNTGVSNLFTAILAIFVKNDEKTLYYAKKCGSVKLRVLSCYFSILYFFFVVASAVAAETHAHFLPVLFSRLRNSPTYPNVSVGWLVFVDGAAVAICRSLVRSFDPSADLLSVDAAAHCPELDSVRTQLRREDGSSTPRNAAAGIDDDRVAAPPTRRRHTREGSSGSRNRSSLLSDPPDCQNDFARATRLRSVDPRPRRRRVRRFAGYRTRSSVISCAIGTLARRNSEAVRLASRSANTDRRRKPS